MQYFSTNGDKQAVSLKEAVLKGLASDGGLYMPAFFERLPASFFEQASNLEFAELSFLIAKQILLEDLPDTELQAIVTEAINFNAPLVKLKEDIFSLELFHGPTLAFKDFGARFMAGLMSYFLTRDDKKLTILVATSGDTGGAVASGFFNKPNIDVVILYPSGKVSELQEKQLTTNGGNIKALEVEGTFDDCQRLVKQAFADPAITSNQNISSANSINIARLIPQSFYYVYSYSRLPDRSIPVVFSVPSGNFGNLTAGLFASAIGLPVHKFIAATNANDVVPRYLSSGHYDPKATIATISNAMDVGSPSNFARMDTIFCSELERFQDKLQGYSYTDEQVSACILEVHQDLGYLLDPHGAIAYLGLRDFISNSTTDAQGIFLETAHPAKFLDVINPILNKQIEIPKRLAVLKDLKKESVKIQADSTQLKDFLLS